MEHDLIVLLQPGGRIQPCNQAVTADSNLSLAGISRRKPGTRDVPGDIRPCSRVSFITLMNSGRMHTVTLSPGITSTRLSQGDGAKGTSTIVLASFTVATLPLMRFARPMKSATKLRWESK